MEAHYNSCARQPRESGQEAGSAAVEESLSALCNLLRIGMRSRGSGASRALAAGATVVALVVVGLGYVFISPGATPSSPLITFNADSYSAEVQALLEGFRDSSGIPVAPTHSAGSNALASQIASGSKDDVFVSAALSAAAPDHLKAFSSGWAIGFASDQMVVAYSNATTPTPAAAQVISEYQRAAESNSTSDWSAAFTSLTSGEVKVGIADPNADPAGLRGWLVLEGAGALYGNGNESAYATPLLKTGGNVTGSAAANMVAPLEAGQMQFLFLYKSLAIAQHLGYIQLDHRINLGDPRLAEGYALLTYKLATGTVAGGPIVLCVTIPSNAPDPAEARQFVQYLVKSSAAVLPSYGLQVFAPQLLYNDSAPPEFVSQMLSQGLLSSGGSLGH
jgi:molybdate/tungstate transport system substrate-binding protein